jgi:hypothetical protein
MRDMHSDITTSSGLAAAVYSTDTNGASIDLQGYDAAELVLAIGVGGITFTGVNRLDFVMQHSDNGSDWAAVSDTDLLGVSGTTGGIVRALVAAHAAAATYRYGYKGPRRFVRVVADFSGTHATGTPLAAVWLRARGHNQPEANQA